jgi:GMP reductase
MKMARAMRQHHMMVSLQKHYPLPELIDFFSNEKDKAAACFYTLGITDADKDKFKELSKHVTLDKICIDVANGYSKYFVDKVKRLREFYPNVILMAGNVATGDMTQELILAGADIVKIGIGPGSVCETRLKTGVGYPQLSAVIECADAAHGLGGLICSDGGCTMPADVVKAFGAGADLIMLGGMLAGTDECDGKWTDNGFEFFGMSSIEAQKRFNGGVREYAAAEGKCVTIPKKGPVAPILRDIMGGIRSACAYVGADSLKNLSKCTTFIQVSRTHNTVFGG